ncbi:MAG: dihydrolipoamide acetyltransferase family protein [Egibacteraceae bacterium]
MATDQSPPTGTASGGTQDYLLPDLGEGLTSGEVVSWLVAVGDTVEVDQPVAEVETAKAVVQLPSPFAGTVTALHAEAGQEVEVGKPLLTIDLQGATAPDEPSAAAGTAPANAETAAMVPDVGGEGDATRRWGGGDQEDGGEAGPVEDAGSGSVLVGYGTGGGRRTRRRRGAGPDRPAATGPASGREAVHSGAAAERRSPMAKPPVRKLAKDLGVDLGMVEGSGPDGIITREDVRAFAGDGRAAPAEAPSQVPPAEDYQQLLREQKPAPAAQPAGGRRIPVKGVRKLIAEKMTTSRREIPEAVTWVDVDATALWELREELNASQPTVGASGAEPIPVTVSPLAIILRACVAALRRFGELNASLDTDAGEIVLHDHVNLGFAAHTDRGLVVPVIKGADHMSTLEIAAELNRLATAARDAKIAPDEMTGGTFTVSNYGSFRVDGGSAVINHPEAAILGVGQIADRPWVVDGELAVRKVVQLSIAFDHRICDGGDAAGFLRLVGDMVERPALLLGSL